MTGGWAPIVLLPEIPYLIFNMLSGFFLASAFCFEKSNQLINCINQAIIISICKILLLGHKFLQQVNPTITQLDNMSRPQEK